MGNKQDNKMIIEREELEGKLRTSIMEVSFNKINGDKRVMACTLNVSHLPPATKKDPLTQEKIRKINEEVMSVWDTNAKGFRSFRMANITEVKRLGSACWCGKSGSYPTCDNTHKSL
jgi:CDGSH-type Zn-finger protein